MLCPHSEPTTAQSNSVNLIAPPPGRIHQQHTRTHTYTGMCTPIPHILRHWECLIGGCEEDAPPEKLRNCLLWLANYLLPLQCQPHFLMPRILKVFRTLQTCSCTWTAPASHFLLKGHSWLATSGARNHHLLHLCNLHHVLNIYCVALHSSSIFLTLLTERARTCACACTLAWSPISRRGRGRERETILSRLHAQCGAQ